MVYSLWLIQPPSIAFVKVSTASWLQVKAKEVIDFGRFV